MSDCAVTIDPGTLLNDPHARQVEFDGEASGDKYRFAVRYDVLEALCGQAPDGDAIQLARAHAATIATAAARSLARGYDREVVVVSENDLD